MINIFLELRNRQNIRMYRDFIVKQTSDFDSQFKAKTLVGNWYEQRCNPGKAENFHFYKQRKITNENINPTLHTQEKFQNSTNNWLNFQHIETDDPFCTVYKNNFKKIEEQTRLSELNPFITKKGELEKNKQALDEYREKWTKSKHVFDSSRASIGHQH